MKRIFPLLTGLAACCVITAASEPAETSFEILDRAQKHLQAHLDAETKEKPTDLVSEDRLERRRDYSLQNLARSLQQSRQSLALGRDDTILQTMGEMQAAGTLPEDVRNDLDALLLLLRAERVNKEAEFTKTVDAACKRASEVLLKASEPKELDGILQELTQLNDKQPLRNGYDGSDNRAGAKLQGAVNFVNRWQDYLLARSRADEQGLSTALHNLSDNNYNNQAALIPRSEILARIPKRESGDSKAVADRRPPPRPQSQIDADAIEIIHHVKSIDDLPAALLKLGELRKEITSQAYNNFRSDTDLGVALTSLQNLQRTWIELQNGLATTINLGSNRSDTNGHAEIENALVPLRVQIIKMAIPRLLGASESEKPAGDEGVDAYLRGLIETAKQRQDWAAVVRGLELKRTLASNSSNPYAATNDQETEAFKSFFAARNLESAGQYDQAVASYLTALRSGQMDLPAKLIGENLAAIEKAHPAEYTSGKEFVLNPPRSPFGEPRFGPGFGQMRGGYDPRFPTGRPGMPGGSNAENLPVPAATPVLSSSPQGTPSPILTATPAASPKTMP